MKKQTIENLDLLNAMSEASFDWNTHFEKESRQREDVFKQVFPIASIVHYNNYERIKYACNLDTPKILYRLLFVYQSAAEAIGRSIKEDFYKNNLLVIESSDGKTVYDFYIYKYEVHIGFYALKKLCTETKEKPELDINSIWRLDYRVKCDNTEVTKQFEAFTKAFIYTPFEIYPGNDFKV